MPAIRLRNAKNVVLRNNYISGFDIGIDAVNSDINMSRNRIQNCDIGLRLTNSQAEFHNDYFSDNDIDIAVNNSRTELIDTIARRILANTPKNDYRINPYYIQNLARKTINAKNIQEKKRNYKTLLKYMKGFTYIWTIYNIVKEALRLAGYSF